MPTGQLQVYAARTWLSLPIHSSFVSVAVQGRIEHETLQVPCANPTSCTSSGFGAVPSLISTLLPWTSSSGGSCGSGCSSDSIGCGTADCSSYAPALIPREVNGQCPLALGDLNSQGMPSTFSCSAFIDASALHEKGRQATPLPSVPNTGTLLTAEAAGAGSAGTGVVTIERDVVLPGCPMNSYPGKNKDNHLCIMCGKCPLCVTLLFVAGYICFLDGACDARVVLALLCLVPHCCHQVLR